MPDPVIAGPGFNRVIQSRHGWLCYNPNDVYVGQAIERYGEYGESEAQLLAQLVRPDDIVIEAGAFIGTHTLMLSRQVGPQGRVIAFEPQRIVFQTLCANMALNSVTNVDCILGACGAAPGRTRVKEPDYGKPGNFGAVAIGGTSGRNVSVYSIDASLNPARLRLIKIDVEGHEVQAIQGAVKTIEKFKPILYVENDRPDRSTALIGLIRSLGYRLFWHMPPLFNPNNFFGATQNVYPNLVSINLLCLHASQVRTPPDLIEATDASGHPLRRN